jgi:poly(beta-D-mannuronate) lyase
MLVRHRKEIPRWIVEVAQQSQVYLDAQRAKSADDGESNHLYWAGVEVAAADIAANDRRLFDWGIETYHAGISQIQPDGSLPLEMRRGLRALHYHLYALTPLIYLAEFGELLHLYAERNSAIGKLVELCTQGLEDNSFFVKSTGIAQDTPNGPPAAEQISWARLYVARFPDAWLSGILAQTRSLKLYVSGRLTAF